MQMMSFAEFGEWAADNIRDQLPEEFRDAKVRIDKCDRLGGSYMGMTVMPEGQYISPTVNLDQFYGSYLKGMDNKKILGLMAKLLQYEHPAFDMDWLFEYSKVKDKLFVRISNAEKNKEMLKNIPHRLIEDLAMSCHIFMDEHDGGFGSTTVVNDMLKSYGVSEEQLFADALENSSRRMPAQILSLEDTVRRIADDHPGGIDSDESVWEAMILTNSRKLCGASALFYPQIMEMIAEKAGGSYFILPSSIHELLILPDDGTLDAGRLSDTVRRINMEVLDERDFLSDNVYYYSAEHRLFGIIEDASPADCPEA